MEKSIDSIGSCSLDADLSTDFSDTSESCNFVSPSATRGDFTQGISERCRRTHQPLPLVPKIIMNQPAFENSSNASRVTTTALFDVDSGKYYSSVDSQTKESSETYTNGSSEKYLSSTLIDLQSPAVVAHANKKPSYLNLACCVNGYSNYTNYDSAERKEINKSREASPIPPFTSISRHSVIKRESPSSSLSITQRRFAEFSVQERDMTDNASAGLRQHTTTETKKSFIQQRVEKLYGTANASNILTTNNSHNNSQNGSKSFSPVAATVQQQQQNDEQIDDETSHALPVMKHLRPEFRSRLTFVSPPKSGSSSNSSNSKHIESPDKERQQTSAVSVSEKIGKVTVAHQPVVVVATVPIVPEKSVEQKNGSSSNMENGNSHELTTTITTSAAAATNSAHVKDGHYFLKVLNDEKTRILSLADEAEQKLVQRQAEDNAPIPEEVVGLVLAAIGKARLLATKKFKQFEGLCHENINPNEDGPQTLADDLQGFWDMMMLQVDNIDESHKEVLQCIDNGWQKPQPPQPEPPKGARLVKRPLAQSNTNKSKSNADAAQKREDQRKKLLELKRKQKAAMQTGEDELISMYNDKNEGSTDG